MFVVFFFLSPLWNKMEDGWEGKKLESGKAANGDSCWHLLAENLGKCHLIDYFLTVPSGG